MLHIDINKSHDDIIRVILHVSKHNYARILLLYGNIFTIETRHYKAEIHSITQSIYTRESIGTSLGGGGCYQQNNNTFPIYLFYNRF